MFGFALLSNNFKGKPRFIPYIAIYELVLALVWLTVGLITNNINYILIIISFIFAYGLWFGKKWIYTPYIIILSIQIIYFIFFDISYILSILVNLFLIDYMFKPHVKEYFGKDVKEVSAFNYCQKCGTENKNDAIFCSKCGNEIGNVNSTVTNNKPDFRSKKDKSKIITLGLMLSWIFGVIFGLGGISFLVDGSAGTGIPSILISVLILPPINSYIEERFNFSLSRGLRITLVVILFVVYASNVPDSITQLDDVQSSTTSSIENTPAISSTSFSEYGNVYCDIDATDLQKETLFNDNFKNKYVKWTGEVSSVSESFDSYNLQVRHCDSTFVSDVTISMKDTQKDKLLQLREGDIVTYTAKLTRYGSILPLSADEGEIVP